MAKMLFLLISVTLAGVLAEPPVPNSYLPPSQNGARAPDSQYGAPFSSNRALSTQYGAPAATSRFGGAATGFGGVPSTQYGAPFASRAMSRFAASGSSRYYSGALSTRYGAPSASSRFGSTLARFGGALSNQYGTPSAFGRSFGAALSNQYGTPSTSGRFGALSSQYGVPAGNSIYAADGGYAAAARNQAREDALAEPANYEFSYEVQDGESGAAFSQEEARQDEQAQGSYRVLLPDGRLQIVEYEADVEGYKPRIRYEDTGAGGYARGGPQQRGQLGGPY